MSMLSLAPATSTLGWLASTATAGSFCLFWENGLVGLPTVTSVSGLNAAAGPAAMANTVRAANMGRMMRRCTRTAIPPLGPGLEADLVGHITSRLSLLEFHATTWTQAKESSSNWRQSASRRPVGTSRVLPCASRVIPSGCRSSMAPKARRCMLSVDSALDTDLCSPRSDPLTVPALLDHPFDHPDDPTRSFWIRPDRRPLQREQARSVWSRPDRRRAPGYGSGGWGFESLAARTGAGLSELAAEDRRLARAHREPDADAGAPGEEVPQVLGERPLHATQGDGSRLTAAGIPGSAETAADAHAEEGAVRQVHVLHFNNQRGVKAAVGDPCISSCPALGDDAADGGTGEPRLGRGATSLCQAGASGHQHACHGQTDEHPRPRRFHDITFPSSCLGATPRSAARLIGCPASSIPFPISMLDASGCPLSARPLRAESGW